MTLSPVLAVVAAGSWRFELERIFFFSFPLFRGLDLFGLGVVTACILTRCVVSFVDLHA